MNRTLAAGLAALVLLAGCASHQWTKAEVDGMIVCNTDAMDQVERSAKRTFAAVHWVNCPRQTLRVI
ncbi:MAG TPA: hypothetical protein VFX05_09145 [Casimicrobiaceae bacterium]|jgi:hypothetical protein|nr:hypothetical protein [Casimicrobiaceae bacterium]